ncbi:MAG: hypothetical protein IKT16_05205 [Desulfovibrio sp.]|nr:hypothetical protein [Desulfovibrio sp.]
MEHVGEALAQFQAGRHQIQAASDLAAKKGHAPVLVFRNEGGQSARLVGQAGNGELEIGDFWIAGCQVAEAAVGLDKAGLRLGKGLLRDLSCQRLPVDVPEGRGPVFGQVLRQPPVDGADRNAGTAPQAKGVQDSVADGVRQLRQRAALARKGEE